MSFKADHATKAIMQCSSLVSSGTTQGTQSTSGVETAQLAAALDYLCLHLTELELKEGFKENKSALSKKTMPRPNLTGNLSFGNKSKAYNPVVPVVGISLAPIPDFKLEMRSFGFVRLGFNTEEATTACRKTSHPSPGTPPERDDEALDVLVDALIKAPERPKPNSADVEFAAMERDEEREALLAIFESRISVISENRYIVDVELTEEVRRSLKRRMSKGMSQT